MNLLWMIPVLALVSAFFAGSGVMFLMMPSHAISEFIAEDQQWQGHVEERQRLGAPAPAMATLIYAVRVAGLVCLATAFSATLAAAWVWAAR